MGWRGRIGRTSAARARARYLILGAALNVALICPATTAGALPGDLDSSFGTAGAVTTNFGWSGYLSAGRALLRQPDGKLVIAGRGWNSDPCFALARYDADGSLDPSFGDNGRVLTVFGAEDFSSGYDAGVYGLVQQSDGKLVAAGRAENEYYGVDIALARYNTDGSLDHTFGSAGRVRMSFTGYDYIAAIALQLDGKVVVAGYSMSDDGLDILLARFQSDGSLDPTFGIGGRSVFDLGGADHGHALVIQSDGKLVVAGVRDELSASSILLARYTTVGLLDASFGNGGVATTAIGAGTWSEAAALVQQSDGKFVAVGHTATSSRTDFAVLRFEADGSMDAGFGIGGIAITSLADSSAAYDVLQQPDGRLVAAGYASFGGGANEVHDFAAVRYNPDGTLDVSFGAAGIATTDVVAPNDEAHALIQQPDGALVLGGVASTGQFSQAFALVRYDSAGGLDSTFGSAGKVTTAASGSDDTAEAVVLQSDGKLVAAGTTRSEADADVDLALARYHPDGSLDATFGVGGKVITDIANGDEEAAGVVQQSSGYLVAGGTATVGAMTQFALVRYRPDGSLDPTFGSGGIVLTPVGTSNSHAYALIQQLDGQLVLAGTAIASGQQSLALARFHPNGSLDAGFGSGGTVITSGGGVAVSLTQQSDGKLVAAGTVSAFGGPALAITRCNSDGTLDQTFGVGGTAFFLSSAPIGTTFFDILQQADGHLVGASGERLIKLNPTGFDYDDPALIGHYAVAQQVDGKLISAGRALYPGHSIALARYNANGSVDTGFGAGGVVITPLGESGAVAALRLQSDTRLIAAGRSDADFALARYFTQNCGNGALEAGEQCDDGNLTSGDCCSSTCQSEPEGNACASDGAVCTEDRCDGAGACAHVASPLGTICRAAAGACDAAESCDGMNDECPPDAPQPNDTPCSDGLFCNGPEICQGGVCLTGEPPCSLLCDEAADDCVTGCLPTPQACRPAAASLLQVKNLSDGTGDNLTWKWSKGAATSQSEFGDPTSTADYAFCIYTGAEAALVGEVIVPAGSGWQTLGSRGYRYRRAAGNSAIDRVLLKGSDRPKSKILLKGQGAALPDLALPLVGAISVQLVNGDNGACWGSSYAGAQIRRNEARQLTARAP